MIDEQDENAIFFITMLVAAITLVVAVALIASR